MKKLAWLTLGLLALGACEMAPGEPTTEEATELREIELREPASPFIAFNIWVKVGSQNDPEGKEGLAALTAFMLSEGSTTADSYDAILAKLYPMAAGYGYEVDKEMTTFTGRIHKDNLEAYYALFKNSLLSFMIFLLFLYLGLMLHSLLSQHSSSPSLPMLLHRRDPLL